MIAQDSSSLMLKAEGLAKFGWGHPNLGTKRKWDRLKYATYDK